REFQLALDKALRGWTGTAGWRKFGDETNAALADLLDGLEGTAVVFTSGGVIAAICAKLWGLDGEGFVAVNRVTANGGMTKLVHGRSGTSLVSFNDHAHFEGEHRELLTYR
ncbi:MAG: histidine phosphatase family protein, partial [Kibdelosporangium sp.]